MKKTILLITAIWLVGCSTDEFIPCDGDGPQGSLCREYRYYNDSPEGYVEFEYGGDSLIISTIYNTDHRLEKTVVERLENGRTYSIAEQFPNSETHVQTWHYDEMDSLFSIVYGANDSSMQLTFENGKRKFQRYFHGSELNRYFEYRYYQDDGTLYRIYSYSTADSLLGYRSFDYFQITGQFRASFYTSDNRLIGRKVFNSQNGLITSSEFTDSTGTVTERSDYIYDASLRLIEKQEMRRNGTLKSVFLYY